MHKLSDEYLILSYIRAKRTTGIDKAFIDLLEDELKKRNLHIKTNHDSALTIHFSNHLSDE